MLLNLFGCFGFQLNAIYDIIVGSECELVKYVNIPIAGLIIQQAMIFLLDSNYNSCALCILPQSNQQPKTT